MNNKFGKLSALNLTAVCKEGKTVLDNVSFTAPFKIMQPFYEKDDFMTVMLLTASAGIMAGDRQELTLDVRENAKMEFVSQAYEKIHRMENDCAKRDVHILVGHCAALNYMPLPVIPFAGSDYRCNVEIKLEDDTSQFVFSEILNCGRVAYGEEFLYNRFRNKVCIYQGEQLVYMDNTCYKPKQMNMNGFGMYEGFTHLANLVICNKPKSDEWIGQVRNLLDEAEHMEGGVTRTAVGHIVVRILGRNGQRLTKMIEQILAL